MPIGIIINALSRVIGGILGAFAGHKLSPKFKEDITLCKRNRNLWLYRIRNERGSFSADHAYVMVLGELHTAISIIKIVSKSFLVQGWTQYLRPNKKDRKNNEL